MTLVLMSTVLVLQGGLWSDFAPRAGLLVEGAAELPKLEEMTVDQLEAERERVTAQMPGVLLPALAFTAGGGVALVGLGFFFFSSMVVGGVMLAIAAPLIVAGIVLVLINAPARNAAGQRLREIRRLKVLREQQQQAPPRFDLTPPPPPPPGVERVVEPGVLLAEF